MSLNGKSSGFSKLQFNGFDSHRPQQLSGPSTFWTCRHPPASSGAGAFLARVPALRMKTQLMKSSIRADSNRIGRNSSRRHLAVRYREQKGNFVRIYHSEVPACGDQEEWSAVWAGLGLLGYVVCALFSALWLG